MHLTDGDVARLARRAAETSRQGVTIPTTGESDLSKYLDGHPDKLAVWEQTYTEAGGVLSAGDGRSSSARGVSGH